MIGAVARKLFGSSNERRIRTYRPRVDAINALEKEIEQLSDEALRARTEEFKKKLADGATLDDILVPAFATVREAGQARARPAPFRRSAHRRHGAARRQDFRDEDRRRQDAGRDAPGLSERAVRPRRACRHRQRLSGQARRRVDGADLHVSSGSRSASSCTASTIPSARSNTIATSPTAPTTSSASTICATT